MIHNHTAILIKIWTVVVVIVW